MKYLYKKNKYYIYKRRIPHSNHFYTFNTKLTNCKKATKLVIIFNKLSRDVFEYIKQQGQGLVYNINEIYKVLDDYAEQALKENDTLEELRHQHIGQLFKIEKDDPLLGKVRLSGGQPEVINHALQSFEYLAVGDYTKTKSVLKKHGADVVKRGTIELKELYKKIRNKGSERELLDFLSILLKAEASILKADRKRALLRFGEDNIMPSEQPQVIQEDYIKQQKAFHKHIDEIEEDFLFNYCNYTEKVLKDSKTNGAKVKKVSNLLSEFIKDRKKIHSSQAITVDTLRAIIKIIPNIPKKPENFNKEYNFYQAYKSNPSGKKDDLRAISTINSDLGSIKRYIDYLTKKKYLSNDDNVELVDFLEVIKRDLKSKVNNNQIKYQEDVEAFKDEMLLKIFNKEYRPYSIIFKKLTSIDVEKSDIYVARFWIPIIMFFTGARVAELVHLKTSDCDFEMLNGEEKLLLFIEANEQKGSKSSNSKRIILVHDFLANDLNFIKFVQKAKQENREYLFNTTAKDEVKVSKEFNRNKDFLEGNLSKVDSFLNTKYTLYSFRHTYKTHMLSIKINETVVNKIQGHSDKKASDGYFSLTSELNESINAFRKHHVVNWNDFIEMSRYLSI